jgi:hypothetical protein
LFVQQGTLQPQYLEEIGNYGVTILGTYCQIPLYCDEATYLDEANVCAAPRFFVETGQVQRRIISWELARGVRGKLTRGRALSFHG